jgi:hypothetical protein
LDYHLSFFGNGITPNESENLIRINIMVGICLPGVRFSSQGKSSHLAISKKHIAFNGIDSDTVYFQCGFLQKS